MDEPSMLLSIETSNPASGAHGRVRDELGRGLLAGPGVGLAPLDAPAARAQIGDVFHVEPLHEPARHNDDLMPAIDRVCARAGVRPRDMARVAVSVGPGGYTGVRIAVASATMIGEATGARVHPVPSGLVPGVHLDPARGASLICLASKRERAWGVLLPGDRAWWARVGEGDRRALDAALGEDGAGAASEAIGEAAGRGGWLDAPVTLGVIGAPVVGVLGRLGVGRLVGDAHLPASLDGAARAGGMQRVEPIFSALGVARLSLGVAGLDPAAVRPIYGREPEAVTRWRARRGGEGAGGG